MELSEYIRKLEIILGEYGDLPVDSYFVNSRPEAPEPKIAYREILTGRQSRDKFCGSWESEEKKGEMVVQV